MSEDGEPASTGEAVDQLLAPHSPEVRDLTLNVRALVRELIPDAIEEVDEKAKLLGYSFIPGTYKGLIFTVGPHRKHVSVIFSKGVELLELDSAGLLEGTGKLARHIKIRTPEQLDDPNVRQLITAAAARTPRS